MSCYGILNLLPALPPATPELALPRSDLADWDAQFERETGKRVAALLHKGIPCQHHLLELGSPYCLICGLKTTLDVY